MIKNKEILIQNLLKFFIHDRIIVNFNLTCYGRLKLTIL